MSSSECYAYPEEVYGFGYGETVADTDRHDNCWIRVEEPTQGHFDANPGIRPARGIALALRL